MGGLGWDVLPTRKALSIVLVSVHIPNKLANSTVIISIVPSTSVVIFFWSPGFSQVMLHNPR